MGLIVCRLIDTLERWSSQVHMKLKNTISGMIKTFDFFFVSTTVAGPLKAFTKFHYSIVYKYFG